MSVTNLGLSVLLLFISTWLFVDGVEVLAARLRLTRFAAGALLAATLTAIPETLIAMISYFQQNSSSELVGVGSVIAAPSITLLIGAPLVALFVKNISVSNGVAKNYVYFIVFFTLAILLSKFNLGSSRYLFSLVFFLVFIYLARSIYVEEGEEFEVERIALVEKIIQKNTWLVASQTGLAAAGLFYGSDLFIDAVVVSAHPFALTLLVSPLATCLGEILLSFYWLLKNRADIALSLLSGENAIQSTFVMSVGLVFTRWSFPPSVFSITLVYLTGAAILSLLVYKRRFKFAAVVLLLYPFYLLAA
ncbi:MAG: hypothetical protein QXE96_05505 [Candidatus Caldarchaeum sp.]|jgi:cation:H+ antiporter